MSTGIAGALEDLRRNAVGDLKDLRRNWGSAYEITGPPVWRAVRRDDQLTLIATGPGKLRDLITANYAARPVSRSLAAASCPCPQIRPEVAAREPHPLMTPAEVADAFGVEPKSVWRWSRPGIWTASGCPAASAGTPRPGRGVPARRAAHPGAGARGAGAGGQLAAARLFGDTAAALH